MDEWGEQVAFEVGKKFTKEDVILYLKKRANEKLSANNYFEIRQMIPRLSEDNEVISIVAWYSNSLLKEEKDSRGYIPAGGFYHLGTFKTDGKS